METKLKRFNEMIEVGKFLLPYRNDLEYLAKKDGWLTRCMHLLEQTFGADSIFASRYGMTLDYGNQEAQVTHGLEIMEMARDELEAEKDFTKLDRVKEQIETGRAEAERRATVAETKLWGAVIEMFDILRGELKKRAKRDQEMLDVHKQ